MSVGLQVPFLDLQAQLRPLRRQIDSSIAAVLDSCAFVNGQVIGEFEQDFARFIGARHCVVMHSGTAALHLALLALDIGPGDEVITAANSFVATAEAIHFAGATPVLVDVDPQTYNIDPACAARAITKRTKAIIPVHLYGQPADLQELSRLARDAGLKLIEDACQAHGATYQGRKVGRFSDVGCFSFYPGKNLGCAGDGGAIVTDSDTIAGKIRLLRDHGSKLKYHHEIVGYNFRLDSIQAAVLKVKLPHLDSWNAKRRSHADYYMDNLKDVPGLQLPVLPADRQSVFHLFVVQVPDRAAVEKAFADAGIGYGIHYPVPIHLQPAFAHLGYLPGSCPAAEKLSQTIISLPMFAELQVDQLATVCRVLEKACRGHL